ncbi:MAG TPA: CHAD domain-containing protein, partial [Acidimicrobiia bacterium]|nr:CHAD domain-containing protein [Acidimicrobiia bacterium]
IERDQARDELLATLRSHRYAVLLDRLVDAARQPRLLIRTDGTSDADVLRGLVREAWDHLADAVDALPEHPEDEELHAIRKRAKRARYAAEAVEPAFGKPARALAREITEVQDVLGEHQDGVVASDWLRRAAAAIHDEGAAFAAGELVAGEREAAAAGRAAWAATWRDAARKKHRAWL